MAHGGGDAADPDDGTRSAARPEKDPDSRPGAARPRAGPDDRTGRLTSGPPPITEDLLPVAHAARHARNVVTEACLRWDLPHLIAPAVLVVSELVGNVVDHAHTMMTLDVSARGSYLHLAVQDGSRRPPVLVLDHDVGETRGFGLHLVAFSSAQWGYTREPGGKVVWATLARDAGCSHPALHAAWPTVDEHAPRSSTAAGRPDW